MRTWSRLVIALATMAAWSCGAGGAQAQRAAYATEDGRFRVSVRRGPSEPTGSSHRVTTYTYAVHRNGVALPGPRGFPPGRCEMTQAKKSVPLPLPVTGQISRVAWCAL